MHKLLATLVLLIFPLGLWAQAKSQIITINESNAEGIWYGVKFPTNNDAQPTIILEEPIWVAVTPTQKIIDEMATEPKAQVRVGTERKEKFAIVHLPIYRKAAAGYEILKSVKVVIDQPAGAAWLNVLEHAKTTATDAVLASGSWYKIGVPKRGIYKMDYNWLKTQLGINPEDFASANFRLYGNGGQILDENNATPRPDDLTENAVVVSDGGDGKINAGDYILFYANGPLTWKKNAKANGFDRQQNLYADSSYYFITFDKGPGKRIATQAPLNNPNVSVNSFNDYLLHEEENFNIGHFGKIWWGNEMSNDPGKTSSYNFTFNLDGIIDSLNIKTKVACASDADGSSITWNINNTLQERFAFTKLYDYDAARSIAKEIFIPYTSNAIKFEYIFSQSTSGSRAYVDYLQLNFRRVLKQYGAQFSFRDFKSVGAGNIAGYSIANAHNNLKIWDVTNPLEPVAMSGTLNNGTYQFNQVAGSLHEFIGFDGSNYETPGAKGSVSNSNLHGQNFADYLIIVHPDFIEPAERLANFHRSHNNLTVNVARTADIYNEFGSGTPDIGAIRDYIKMFYDRAGTNVQLMPKNVLLFGDASYDYKYRTKNNTNFVPTQQATESVNSLGTYCTDDYFTYLDEHENIEDYSIINLADVGIGRLPVGNIDEANNVVDKILRYKSAASLGPWRLRSTMIADNEDPAGHFIQDAEEVANVVDHTSPIFTNNKIYLDNIPFINTPAGERSPVAVNAINQAVNRGTFIMNYTGHGSPSTLAHERIITKETFETWNNADMLPLMITTTCDFSQYDRPEFMSAGEQLILKPNGGAIAMLTTSHSVFSSDSRPINRRFVEVQFEHNNNTWRTYGDAMRVSKNEGFLASPYAGFYINTHKFTLLGDPALTPNFPRYNVVTDSMRDLSGGLNVAADTIKALGNYQFYGSVRGDQNEVLTGFNGMVDISIYDKPKHYDLNTKHNGHMEQFSVQENIIYKGKVSVTNGLFNYMFIAPKDLNYTVGKGKMVYYAQNGVTDAAGSDTSLKVGGFSPYPINDYAGPIVRAFMGDSLFIDGSIVGANSAVYAILSDESGINVSGNSIGHDLVAILDGDENNPYIMNEYYETEPNTFKRGYVKFAISGLPEGKHTIKVRAWDVNNNSGEGLVHFEVLGGNVAQVGTVVNFPNPFSNKTNFLFEHNMFGEKLEVDIVIFNTMGARVKRISTSLIPENNRSQITWDGRADNGAVLGSGVYPYSIQIKGPNGKFSKTQQKLVITR